MSTHFWNERTYRWGFWGPARHPSCSWRPQSHSSSPVPSPRPSWATWSSRWPAVRSGQILGTASPRSSNKSRTPCVWRVISHVCFRRTSKLIICMTVWIYLWIDVSQIQVSGGRVADIVRTGCAVVQNCRHTKEKIFFSCWPRQWGGRRKTKNISSQPLHSNSKLPLDGRFLCEEPSAKRSRDAE